MFGTFLRVLMLKLLQSAFHLCERFVGEGRLQHFCACQRLLLRICNHMPALLF